jgi:hypothetical protein
MISIMASSKESPLCIFLPHILEIFVNFYVSFSLNISLSIFTKVYSMEDALSWWCWVWRVLGLDSHRFAPSFRNFSCMTFRNINQLVSKCFHNVPPPVLLPLNVSNPNHAHLSTEPEAWISTWIFLSTGSLWYILYLYIIFSNHGQPLRERVFHRNLNEFFVKLFDPFCLPAM